VPANLPKTVLLYVAVRTTYCSINKAPVRDRIEVEGQNRRQLDVLVVVVRGRYGAWERAVSLPRSRVWSSGLAGGVSKLAQKKEKDSFHHSPRSSPPPLSHSHGTTFAPLAPHEDDNHGCARLQMRPRFPRRRR